MKSPKNATGKHHTHAHGRLCGEKAKSKIDPSISTFATNLQKYVALHARSKQILEQLHAPRTGSAGFPQVRSGHGSRKGEFLAHRVVLMLSSFEGSVPRPPTHPPNSWLRPTVGQAFKKRKKVETTAAFFETVVDDELRSIDEKLSSLKKIYMTGMKTMVVTGVEAGGGIK